VGGFKCLVLCSCEHGNKPWIFINGREFLDRPNDSKLVKKGFFQGVIVELINFYETRYEYHATEVPFFGTF
jgi:hypothetical protein